MNYEVRKYFGKTNSYKLIDNVSLPIDIHLKQNEELDTASFDIVDVNYKRRIPKNTKIEIVETESDTHYQFVVVYDDVELTKQQNGSSTIITTQPLYTHHITLVESTALLEQIQLSNLTFSIDLNSQTTTPILDILERLINIVNFSKLETDMKLFELSQSLIEKLSQEQYNIKTEFFFNELNLLECLRNIGEKINAIPKLVDYKYIDYYFLNTNEKTWDDTQYDFSYNENLQSPNEYCTNLVSFGKNLVSSDNLIEGSIEFPYSGGFVSTNTLQNETVRISNDTAVFYLGGNKIYDIQSLIIKNYDTSNPNNTLDITSYLYEKKQYDILPDNEDVGGKGMALIYDQYGTYIYGLSNQPIAGFKPPYTALANILKANNVNNINSFSEILFNCKFRRVFDNLDITEKTNNSDFEFNNDLLINQTTNQVSTQNYSSYKSAKMNKLANIEELKTYIFDNISDVPNLGDVLLSSNYYVNEIKLSLYNNAIMAEIKTTKDFNKISEFISVNSRKRPFPIPVDNFVTSRHINLKEYVRFSNSNTTLKTYLDYRMRTPTSKNINSHITDLFLKYIFSNMVLGQPTIPENEKKCNLCGLRTFTNNVSKDILLINTNSYVGSDNCLNYSFSMIDNISAGTQSLEYQSGNRKSFNVLYAQNGIVDFLQYLTYLVKFSSNNVLQPYAFPQLLDPELDENNSKSIFNSKTDRLYIFKDLREILNLTTQIQFVTDESNIFIKKNLLDKNITINNKEIPYQPELYCLEDRVLGQYENALPADAIKIEYIEAPQILLGNGYSGIQFSCQPTICKSWFLVDRDNKILMGQNDNLEETNTIYAIPSTERVNPVDPYHIIEMDIETTGSSYSNRTLIPYVEIKTPVMGDGYYNIVDFGDGTQYVNDDKTDISMNYRHSYIEGNNPYVYNLFTRDYINFSVPSQTIEGVKINSINIYGDNIYNLELSNANEETQNVLIQELDISKLTNLESVNMEYVLSLQNIIIDKNNNLKNINVSYTGFINNQEVLLNIIDNLQYNDSGETYTFYASGITDQTIRQNVQNALQLKNWSYEF